MISVEEIRRQAQNAWDSGDILKAAIVGDPVFPMRLRFKKTGGQHTIESFSQVQKWISELHQSCKATTGYGYLVELSEVNHRKLGRQQLPTEIRFDTPQDAAAFIGKKKVLEQFTQQYEVTRGRNIDAASWMSKHPIKALRHKSVWESLLNICDYLSCNQKPHIYLRQLPLVGMDTKFFEDHRSILAELLCACLPVDAYNPNISGLSKGGFERKFGFLFDTPSVRLRLLDDDLLPFQSHRDIAVPADKFAEVDIPGCETVFITENKVNGLAFPKFKKGVVIFGLGYGVAEIAETPWLREKRVVYWGDIDTHGYGILSMLRGKLPHVESLLMTSADLDECISVAVVEPAETRRTDYLSNLTTEEQITYKQLLPGGDSEFVRIEQERVPFTKVTASLRSLS